MIKKYYCYTVTKGGKVIAGAVKPAWFWQNPRFVFAEVCREIEVLLGSDEFSIVDFKRVE